MFEHLSHERTIRLLMDWPIQGLRMKGWIVQKEAQAAARLVSTGYAEYVLAGTSPPPDQMEWTRSIANGSPERGH